MPGKTAGKVVCVSGLPVNVQKQDVVDAVEASTQQSVQKALYVWNAGLALFEVKQPVNLQAQKVELKGRKIRPGKGRAPMIEISTKPSVAEQTGSEVVLVRFYAVNPDRDLRKASDNEKAAYAEAEKVWEENDGQASDEFLASLANFVSECTGVVYHQFAAPKKVFSKTNAPEGRSPRLYAQVLMSFCGCSDALRANQADGQVLQMRGLKCVARVESSNVSRMSGAVLNPCLVDADVDSFPDEPPQLLEPPQLPEAVHHYPPLEEAGRPEACSYPSVSLTPHFDSKAVPNLEAEHLAFVRWEPDEGYWAGWAATMRE